MSNSRYPQDALRAIRNSGWSFHFKVRTGVVNIWNNWVNGREEYTFDLKDAASRRAFNDFAANLKGAI